MEDAKDMSTLDYASAKDPDRRYWHYPRLAAGFAFLGIVLGTCGLIAAILVTYMSVSQPSVQRADVIGQVIENIIYAVLFTFQFLLLPVIYHGSNCLETYKPDRSILLMRITAFAFPGLTIVAIIVRNYWP